MDAGLSGALCVCAASPHYPQAGKRRSRRALVLFAVPWPEGVCSERPRCAGTLEMAYRSPSLVARRGAGIWSPPALPKSRRLPSWEPRPENIWAGRGASGGRCCAAPGRGSSRRVERRAPKSKSRRVAQGRAETGGSGRDVAGDPPAQVSDSYLPLPRGAQDVTTHQAHAKRPPPSPAPRSRHLRCTATSGARRSRSSRPLAMRARGRSLSRRGSSLSRRGRP